MAVATARIGMIYDLIAPPLILLTPFISFINYNGYSYRAPEFWLCAVGLIALGLFCSLVMTLVGKWLHVVGTAGLLMLFVDIQFEWFDSPSRVQIPAFAIGTLLLCGLLREHLSRITVAVFGTGLAAGLLPCQLERAARSSSSSTRPCSGHANPRPAGSHTSDL
jgi:hypothetical protein